MNATDDRMIERLLAAALAHVPFDGWSEATLQAACRDAGISREQARLLCPRGAVDLARAHHAAADRALAAAFAARIAPTLRMRERIAAAVRLRLELAGGREIARRSAALFALPQHAADGARAVWGTADLIWTLLGDISEDLNWYTKRATLAGVIGAAMLYWLGDETPGAEATAAFIDRRIEDVMRIEGAKARLRESPAAGPLMRAQAWISARVRRPAPPPDDLPGRWRNGP
jgi:ubiquinone biosynthesis protein COQ9